MLLILFFFLANNQHCTSTFHFQHEKHIMPWHSTLVQDVNFNKSSNMSAIPMGRQA